jgi:peptidyl-prolyl cis-trans isomerase B (cyclophilin B)
MSKNPEVTITMTDGKEIKLELYPDQAENTVKNFIELAADGYYDGLKFHRVIKGFMIQGGCPDGTGMGGPGYAIKGEFSANGYENDLSHKRGVISMARSSHPDSAGSQFFIVHKDSPHLDGKYAAFGEVIEGMEAVDQIAEVETGARDMPREDQIMETVEVDTFDVEYEAAERV